MVYLERGKQYRFRFGQLKRLGKEVLSFHGCFIQDGWLRAEFKDEEGTSFILDNRNFGPADDQIYDVEEVANSI